MRQVSHESVIPFPRSGAEPKGRTSYQSWKLSAQPICHSTVGRSHRWLDWEMRVVIQLGEWAYDGNKDIIGHVDSDVCIGSHQYYDSHQQRKYRSVPVLRRDDGEQEEKVDCLPAFLAAPLVTVPSLFRSILSRQTSQVPHSERELCRRIRLHPCTSLLVRVGNIQLEDAVCL